MPKIKKTQSKKPKELKKRGRKPLPPAEKAKKKEIARVKLNAKRKEERKLKKEMDRTDKAIVAKRLINELAPLFKDKKKKIADNVKKKVEEPSKISKEQLIKWEEEEEDRVRNEEKKKEEGIKRAQRKYKTILKRNMKKELSEEEYRDAMAEDHEDVEVRTNNALEYEEDMNEEAYEVNDESWEDYIKRQIKEKGVNKTLKNRDWRIDNLYKIRNKEGDIVVFKMNKVQRDYDSNRWTRNLIVKARQMGMSTYKVVDAIDRTLFTPNSNNIIIAHTLPDAQKLFAKIELAWNHLPRFIKLMVYVKSKTAGGMEIGLDRVAGESLKNQPGKVVSAITVATSGMGGTYSSAHITELGYLDAKYPEKAQEIITGTIPAIPLTGDLDIESTARGNFGQFYDLVQQFKGKEPVSGRDFKVFFYSWRWDEYELGAISESQIEFLKSGQADEWEKFKEYQDIHNLTDRELTCYYYFWVSLGRSWSRLRSEYPTTIEEAFSSDDENIFPAYTLEKFDIGIYKQIGSWKYYEMPKIGETYVLGCDPAEGVGKDNHAIVIMNISGKKPKLVATYTNNDITPTDLAYQVLHGCRMYNNCMACVERNNSGHATLGQLQQIYPSERIYQELIKGKATTPNRTRRLGWLTAAHTKYKMVYDFKDLVDNDNIVLNSSDLIEELKMFSKQVIVSRMGVQSERLTVERKGGSHADLAISAFICIQCLPEAQALSPSNEQGGAKRKAKLELRKSMK